MITSQEATARSFELRLLLFVRPLFVNIVAAADTFSTLNLVLHLPYCCLSTRFSHENSRTQSHECFSLFGSVPLPPVTARVSEYSFHRSWSVPENGDWSTSLTDAKNGHARCLVVVPMFVHIVPTHKLSGGATAAFSRCIRLRSTH